MPQLNKFLRGIARAESQNVVSRAIYDEIEKEESLKTFVKSNVGSSEIHKVLSEIVSSPPEIVVIIDEATEEVRETVEDFKKIPIVIEFKTFVREDKKDLHIHMFEPINSKNPESNLEKEKVFFKSALEELNLKAPQITNARLGHGTKHAWVEIKTQRRGVAFYFALEKDTVFVDLYIGMGDKTSSQNVFDFFLKQKHEIEKAMDSQVTWERTHPQYSQASRIIIRNNDYSNLFTESKSAITWGVENLIKLYQMLSPQLSDILK